MTDEQLIERMRQVEWGPCQLAADRIEALVKERDAAKQIALVSIVHGQDAEARAERLEEALQAILFTAHTDDHVGWRTALEDARAALKGTVTQPAPDTAAIREAVAKVRTKLADQDDAALLLGAEWALTMIEALTEKP